MEKSKSIKQTLPKLTQIMIVFFLVLILPANIYLQLHMQHRSQRENSIEMFGQLEQLIQDNEEDLENEKEMFREKCIRAADLAAYFTEHHQGFITDLEHTRELAEKLNVDEIHYFNSEGEIYAGTHPQYYGLRFDSGEQMSFFLPMLKNRSMKLCQNITPNTAEGKEMQYAAVWMEDEDCIVQIGMEPKRLLKEMQEKSLQNIITALPFEVNGFLHIVNKNTLKVVASTARHLVGMNMSHRKQIYDHYANDKIHVFHEKFGGKRCCVYAKEYREYLLIRTYLSWDPLKEIAMSTVLVLLYVTLVAFGVIGIIRWYIDRKLVRNLKRIIHGLEKIEDGNVDTIIVETGVLEFDNLLFYINHMLDNIRSNWNKLSDIIDKGKIPVGILERNLFYKKTFVNERMLDILGLMVIEGEPSENMAALVQEKLTQAELHEVDPEEHIYEYNKNGSIHYLCIEKESEKQSITYYVTDVSLWWEEIHQLREQNEIDLLTKLYNRRGFLNKTAKLFLNKEELGCAMLMIIDADNLKIINDQYGHAIGDAYIQAIAGILQEAVDGHGICARMGGDEFVAFFYGASNIIELENIISTIKKKRGNVFIGNEMDCPSSIQFSVGIAFYPMDGQDVQLLMRVADENMYQEKKERKREKKSFRMESKT